VAEETAEVGTAVETEEEGMEEVGTVAAREAAAKVGEVTVVVKEVGELEEVGLVEEKAANLEVVVREVARVVDWEEVEREEERALEKAEDKVKDLEAVEMEVT
jgi:hypothetical protein